MGWILYGPSRVQSVATTVADTVVATELSKFSVRAVLANDVTVNSTTFASVFTTQSSLEANTYYKVFGEIGITSSATIDGYFAFLLPTGAGIFYSSSFQFDGIQAVSSGSTVGATPSPSLPGANCIEIVGASSERKIKFSGGLLTGGTAGTISLLVAGKTTGNCTVESGTYIDFAKMVAV